MRTAGPDDARGSRGPETRPAAAKGTEPPGPGQLRSESRKRGPWAPLCEGRGRRGGSEGPQVCSRQPRPPRGAFQLPSRAGPLQARPPPHAPCLGSGSYRRGIYHPIPTHPDTSLPPLPSPALNFLFFARRALRSSARSSPVRRFPPPQPQLAGRLFSSLV